MDTMRDIFICHASEDKKEVVRPIVEAFRQAGISVWFDEAEIKWGDSIAPRYRAPRYRRGTEVPPRYRTP